MRGELRILREYSCGCILYRDDTGKEWTEAGLFCEPVLHEKRERTQGEPDQRPLF
jgi:hypothetical protein